MRAKKICRWLLLPHIAILLLLVPFSATLLVGSMLFVGTNTVVAYVSYALSAYTSTVCCLRIPRLIRLFKHLKKQSRLAEKWQNDARFRMNVSLFGSFAWNTLYGIFQLWLGIYHHTFWFFSFGLYYICLAVMRFFLVQHTRKYASGEQAYDELKKYRACGWILLVMNAALALIIFFMVYWNRTFEHHMITAIAMATYTFTALIIAIVNVIKYKRYNSPVYSAAKAISLAAALVSMLTLESTMLTTFGQDTMTGAERTLLLGATGAAISLLIILEAIYMIVIGTKRLKQMKEVPHGSYHS